MDIDHRLMRAAAHLDGRPGDESPESLAIARLMLELDAGTLIYPGRTLTEWHALLAEKRFAGGLSATVNAAIAAGLANHFSEPTGPHTVRQRLVAAHVHKRSEYRTMLPVCVAVLHPVPWIEPEHRWRLMDEWIYVDCQACVDAAGR